MSLYSARSRPKGRSLSPPPGTPPSQDYNDDKLGKERFRLSGGGPFDVEAGVSLPQARTLRRSLQRRSRVIIAVIACVTVFLYYTSLEGYSPPPPPREPVPFDEIDQRLGGENIWDDLPPPIDDKKPAGKKAPAPPARPPRPDDPHFYVVDKNGDHFLTNVGRRIPPLNPGPKDFVDPDTLFPEVNIATYLRKPDEEQFPDSKLREITSDPLPGDKAWVKAALPDDSYAANWKGPANWQENAPGVKDMQWPSFKTKDREWESKEQRELRIKRRDAVKRAFVYGWQAYKDKAWGHDEVRPQTGQTSDPFNAWGASIVDTLDTLLVLGLQDEYNLCRPHVNQINFNWITGRDWSQGYRAPTSEGGWTENRDKTTGLPVFESGIRYLGGLLGAYDLSGDKLMLDRAVDIAEVLGRAFNTRSGLPQGSRIDPGAEAGYYNLHTVSIAEVGSMTLELIRLSQATGDRKWFDLAQRGIDYINEQAAPRSKFKPLLPMAFAPDGTAEIGGSFSFGAMTDSYYEYLIKAYKLLGGGELAKVYRRLYEDSIDAARKLLFTPVDVIPNRDLMTIGKYEGGVLKRETEHLACFAGGMLAMGAKLLDRPKDMADAAKFTTTCYWIGAGTPTGIQPEVVHFYDKNMESAFENITTDGNRWHAPIKKPFTDDQIDHTRMFKDHDDGSVRWIDDRTLVKDDSGRKPNRPITYYRSIRGSPPGVSSSTGYYINRPETIESVFYMYRLTGDRAWQDKGWRMFGSWMNHSRVAHGFSSIHDVTREPQDIVYGNNMESFIFAETFKYHYLLQADPELLSLDNYVFNTEAHPFIANYERDLKPGGEGLWDSSKVAGQDLGVRGQGTNVQKWLRLEHLLPVRNRKKAAMGKKAKGDKRGLDDDDGAAPFVEPNGRAGIPGRMPRRRQ